jgi:glycerophosphoryl diester phosphodiesterase
MPLPIAVPPHFRIIAHRGASAYAPENTRAAFQLAAKMGIWEVELDVQLTTDGVAVLCHDASLARYGYEAQMVETMTWPELAQLDFGSWFSPYLFGGEPMWTLEGLFRTFGDRFLYHVEIKGRAAGLPQAVHDLIVAHGMQEHCFITSFADAALVAMRRIDPGYRLGWLVQAIDEEVLARAAALELFQLCPRASGVTPEAVARARTVATEVRAWGLMGETTQHLSAEVQQLIERVLASGCDGMTINWPDWVRHEAV